MSTFLLSASIAKEILNEVIDHAVAQSDVGPAIHPAIHPAPPPVGNEDAEELTGPALQAAVDACAIELEVKAMNAAPPLDDVYTAEALAPQDVHPVVRTLVTELVTRVEENDSAPVVRLAPPPVSSGDGGDAEEPTAAAVQAAVDGLRSDHLSKWLVDPQKKHQHRLIVDCCVGSRPYMLYLLGSLKASGAGWHHHWCLVSKASSLEPLDDLLPQVIRILGNEKARQSSWADETARILAMRSDTFVQLLASDPAVLTCLFMRLDQTQTPAVRGRFMACLEKVADNPRFNVAAFASAVVKEHSALPSFLLSVKCATSRKVCDFVDKILAALPPLDDAYTAERSDFIKSDEWEVERLKDRLSRGFKTDQDVTLRRSCSLSDELKQAITIQDGNGQPAIDTVLIEPLTRVIGEPFVTAIRPLIASGGANHQQHLQAAFHMLKGSLARHEALKDPEKGTTWEEESGDVVSVEATLGVGGAPLAKALDRMAKTNPRLFKTLAQVTSLLRREPSDNQSRDPRFRSKTADFVDELASGTIIHSAVKFAALEPSPAQPDAGATRSSALNFVADLTQTPAAEQRAARIVTGVPVQGSLRQQGVVSDVATVLGKAVSIEATGALDKPTAKFCNAVSKLDRFSNLRNGSMLLPNLYEVYNKQTANSPPAIGELALGAAGTQPPARRPALDVLNKAKQLFLQTSRVEQRLEESFSTHRDCVVEAQTLFELHIPLEYKGTPRQILAQFADRLEQFHARLLQQGGTGTKLEAKRYAERLNRFRKAIIALRNPKPTLEKEFLSKLDAVESIRQLHARARDAAALALAASGAAADQPAATELAPPPAALPAPAGQPAPPAPLLAIAPPPASLLTTDEEIFAHLDGKISLTPDCAKCVVARTDPAARLAYTEQGGRGVARVVGLISACPLFEHGVSKKRLAELLDDVTALGNIAKRQKVDQYMWTKHSVTPLGKPDGAVPHNVPLYHRSAAGVYTPVGTQGGPSTSTANVPRHKGFFQGFQLA